MNATPKTVEQKDPETMKYRIKQERMTLRKHQWLLGAIDLEFFILLCGIMYLVTRMGYFLFMVIYCTPLVFICLLFHMFYFYRTRTYVKAKKKGEKRGESK